MGWKQLLKFERKRKEMLGLDIGSSVVKLVQMHKNSSGYIVTAAEIAEIDDEQVTDKDSRKMNIVRAIHTCLKTGKFQSKLAVCNVSGREVAVRPFNFPQIPPEEIEGAVFFEADQVCPFSINDSAVDYQLIANDDDSIKGVLVAATNKVLQNRKRIVESASLDAVLMDVDGLALLNCFNEYEKEQKDSGVAAILNVGGNCSTLAMMGDDGTPFVRDMNYAGNEIMKQLVDLTGAQWTEIGAALFDGKEAQDMCPDFRQRLQEASGELIVDVNETLRYYTAQKKSSVVEKIYVCGGFALAKGFVELLDKQLTTSAVLWNPFERFSLEASPSCEEVLQNRGPALALAAGLAMRSV
ncbi:type IV pilus assembly protein PilM [Planctomycetota bacterium]